MQHAVRTRPGSMYMDVAREGEGWTPLMGWTSGERAVGRGYVTKESMQCFCESPQHAGDPHHADGRPLLYSVAAQRGHGGQSTTGVPAGAGWVVQGVITGWSF